MPVGAKTVSLGTGSRRPLPHDHRHSTGHRTRRGVGRVTLTKQEETMIPNNEDDINPTSGGLDSSSWSSGGSSSDSTSTADTSSQDTAGGARRGNRAAPPRARERQKHAPATPTQTDGGNPTNT